MRLVKIGLTLHTLLKGINKVMLITCIVTDGPVKFYKKRKSSHVMSFSSYIFRETLISDRHNFREGV